MTLVEMIRPLGPWLTSAVTATVEGSPAEIAALGDLVEWAGPTFSGRAVYAHLRGATPGNAARILALQDTATWGRGEGISMVPGAGLSRARRRRWLRAVRGAGIRARLTCKSHWAELVS